MHKIYRKHQKLSEKKLCSSLNLSKCRENFLVFALSVLEVLKKANAHNIYREIFYDFLKIYEIHEF